MKARALSSTNIVSVDSLRAWERAWPVSARLVNLLVLVNISLQVCDGVTTWVGLQRGIKEANPLIRYALDALGPGWGLFLWKVEACVWIGLLRSLGARPLVAAAVVQIRLIPLDSKTYIDSLHNTEYEVIWDYQTYVRIGLFR